MTRKLQMERKRMTKVERFYIEQNCTTMSIEQIQADLRLPKKVIEKLYNECRTEQEEKEKKEQQVTAEKLMIKNDRGSVAMTSAASQLGDETRQASRNIEQINEKRKQYIHKIR